MEDQKDPPIVLANKVLRLFVDHLLGEDMITTSQDYTALRVAFRKCGGSWDQVVHGNIVQTHLLTKLVVAWGKLPGRKRNSEEAEPI